MGRRRGIDRARPLARLGVPSVTLRITHAVASPSTIELHGRLSAAEVAEFERTAAEAGLPLRIEIGQLVGADAEGLTSLRRQRGRGARLSGASPYIELLLGGPSGEADRRPGE
jgi:hypothetical protein